VNHVVIDQDGNEEEWVAVYWRYHSQYTYEADSLDDALRFLHSGEDNGDLSSGEIRGPSGAVVMDRAAIDASYMEWPHGDWLPRTVRAEAPHEITPPSEVPR
jgi:hypothetical protein